MNFNIPFIETSAFTGENINEAFEILAEKIIQSKPKVDQSEVGGLLQAQKQSGLIREKVLSRLTGHIISMFPVLQKKVLSL